MSFLDIVIVLILFLSIIHSVFRGFVKEVFFLVSIVLGFLGASHYHHQAVQLLRPLIHVEPVRDIVGFAIVFLICAIAVSLVGGLLRRLLKKTKVGWLDHLLGLFFGILKGIVLVSILMMVLVSFLPHNSRITSESRLAPKVVSITKTLVAVTPPALRQQFDTKLGELKKIWDRREVEKRLKDYARKKLPPRGTTEGP